MKQLNLVETVVHTILEQVQQPLGLHIGIPVDQQAEARVDQLLPHITPAIQLL
jgi:hypothetical protein